MIEQVHKPCQMDNNYEQGYGMDSYDDKQSYGKDIIATITPKIVVISM